MKKKTIASESCRQSEEEKDRPKKKKKKMATSGGVPTCKLSTSIQASLGAPDDPDYVFDIAVK
jgi:hypothetical protein